MIASVEGRHDYYPPGTTYPKDAASVRIGGDKDDAGNDVFPRARLQRCTIGGLGDPDDVADPIIGSFGEQARPSQRKGKTVTYSGVIEALSLADFRSFEDTFRAALADQTTPGLMVVSWHPLARPMINSTTKKYPARAMGLEIADPIESPNVFRGSFVAAFRNHDGRHFELAESSKTIDIAATGGAGVGWGATPLGVSRSGPVLDVISNAITNRSGDDGTTTGWVASGAPVTTFDTVNLLTSSLFEPIFDPPTTHALHVITDGTGAAGNGGRWNQAVTSGVAYHFVAWVRNRNVSAAAIRLEIRNAAGTIKATSAVTALANSTWTKLEVRFTADLTETWQFRVAQSAAGACEFAFANCRLTNVEGMTLDPGFGPRINFPSSWDAPDLHLDFHALSVLDDAGHDWTSLINPSFGIWSRDPWGANAAPSASAVVTTGGPATDPNIVLTFRWTLAYW